MRALSFALVVAVAACSGGPSKSEAVLRVGGVELSVEVASTPEARQQGLMGRESLNEDTGMAFTWDEPTDGGFWMKDTPIPLSIAFWDEAGHIVAILDMEPCEEDPCPLYDPGVEYVGAVEVDQGWFEDNHVQVGDSVEWVVR